MSRDPLSRLLTALQRRQLGPDAPNYHALLIVIRALEEAIAMAPAEQNQPVKAPEVANVMEQRLWGLVNQWRFRSNQINGLYDTSDLRNCAQQLEREIKGEGGK